MTSNSFHFSIQNNIGNPAHSSSLFYMYEKNDCCIRIGCVANAHGQHKYEISNLIYNYVRDAFMHIESISFEWNKENWIAFLHLLFENLQIYITELIKKLDIAHYTDSMEMIVNTSSGSSLTIVVHVLNASGYSEIFTANVGNLVALLVYYDSLDEKNYEYLNEDHTAGKNLNEFLRIRDLPNELYPEKYQFVYDCSNSVHPPIYWPRLYSKSGVIHTIPSSMLSFYGLDYVDINNNLKTGLFTNSLKNNLIRYTRSLGQSNEQRFGITHIPSIKYQRIDQSKKFVIIISSVGLWNSWKTEELVSTYCNLLKTKNIYDASKDLFESSICNSLLCYGAIDDMPLITWGNV